MSMSGPVARTWHDEQEWLDHLRDLGLSPSSDARLERLAAMVRRQLDAPVALLSLVGPGRQVFPGLDGLEGWAADVRGTPPSHSFCRHVVERRGPLAVTDARTDARFSDNPAVEELGVVAYLGVPLATEDGDVLGALCVIDHAPREWTAQEARTLTDLARLFGLDLRSRTGPDPERAQRTLDSIPAMIGYWDSEGRNVLSNRAYVEWLGLTPDEISGRLMRDVLGEAMYELNRSFIEGALAGRPQEFQRTILSPDGEARHSQTSYVPDRDTDGNVIGFVAHVADVTRLADAVRFHDAVLAATPDLIYVLDLATREVIWASRSFSEMLGYQPEDIVELGDDLYRAMIHPDDVATVGESNNAVAALADGETLELRLRVRRADGTQRWMQRRVTPFERGPDGRVQLVLGLTRDIHEQVELAERLEAAAVCDSLTGLPNRRLLADRLERALRSRDRSAAPVAVLFVDLDGFKRINDTAGHRAGDTVLITTGRRIASLLRAGDTVARVGGDEFVVLLQDDRTIAPATTPPTATAVEQHAAAVARRICSLINEPIVHAGQAHYVTASVGVALATAADEVEDVIRNADSAMYKAKAHGKARIEVYDTSLRTEADETSRIEAALRQSVRLPHPFAGRDREEEGNRSSKLSVFYQPVYDVATMRLVGVEALARLDDHHGLAISPAQFIPIAEETGLISNLGAFVLDRACADLASWDAAFPQWRQLGVAVNLSTRQAGLADLVADVTSTLARNALSPERLTLEVTESVLLEAGSSTMTAVHALRSDGVKIAIDDFGTGYASLRYLAQLPVTSVKVDRSFTSGLPDDPVSSTIVRAVRGLARDLDIGCVVEGIETEQQLRSLPSGVLGQGFLLGRPMPETGIRDLLARARPVGAPA